MSIINSFLDTMASLASQSGFAGFLVDGGWKNIVMILISFVFMYLAIAKGFEPLLLLPISFGMLLTNLPYAEMYHPDFWNYKTVAGNDHYIDYGQILQKGGLLDILYMGVKLQIYPPLIFLGILGGYSLYLQKNGIVDLVSILEKEGNEGVVLAIMQTLPFSKILIVLLVILCFVFLATTIDSTAMVLGTATSKNLDPEEDPHLLNRFSWAIAIFAIAIGLSTVGGLKLIQKFAIVLGFPLIFIVFLISYSAIKAMKQDFGKMTKEEIIAVCQGTGESTQTNETEEKTEIKLAKSTDGNSKSLKATRDEKREQKTVKKMKCQKA